MACSATWAAGARRSNSTREGGLVQVGVLGRHLVVHGQAYQVVTEHGPAVSGLEHQTRPDQRFQGQSGLGGPEAGHVGGHLRTKTRPQHAGGPQICFGARAHTGEP